MKNMEIVILGGVAVVGLYFLVQKRRLLVPRYRSKRQRARRITGAGVADVLL